MASMSARKPGSARSRSGPTMSRAASSIQVTDLNHPDRFVVAKRDLTILERHVARKDKVIGAPPTNGNGRIHAPSASSLTDEEVVALARLGQRVEKYFNYPCDIEWGLSQGRFYLLQARAIKLGQTSLRSPFSVLDQILP